VFLFVHALSFLVLCESRETDDFQNEVKKLNYIFIFYFCIEQWTKECHLSALRHFSYIFYFPKSTSLRCVPPPRLHSSSLSRKVLIAFLTMSGVAVTSSFIAFLSSSMSRGFVRYTLHWRYPQRK